VGDQAPPRDAICALRTVGLDGPVLDFSNSEHINAPDWLSYRGQARRLIARLEHDDAYERTRASTRLPKSDPGVTVPSPRLTISKVSQYKTLSAKL
jgi:hypothetical protein